MLDAGYEVVSLARSMPDAVASRLHALEVDLLDAAATGQAAAASPRRFAVTHVVHNAGVIRPALLADVELGDLDALAQLHLGAALLLVQAVLPGMQRGGSGASCCSRRARRSGLATRTAYSATKAGMVGMARTWALELAAYGITVNVVAPGPIADTEMFHSVVPEDSERETALAAAIPVRRLGSAGRRCARCDVLLRPGQRLHHRSDALCLRWRELGQSRHLVRSVARTRLHPQPPWVRPSERHII